MVGRTRVGPCHHDGIFRLLIIMRTKQNRKKRTRKQKGRGVGIYQKKFEAFQKENDGKDTYLALYSELLHDCTFHHLSSGSFGYTYIASNEESNDFGFRNEKREPVNRFLVKIVPLDYEKTKGVYALKSDGLYHPGKIISTKEGIIVSVDDREYIVEMKSLFGDIGTEVMHNGEIGILRNDYANDWYVQLPGRNEPITLPYHPIILTNPNNSIKLNDRYGVIVGPGQIATVEFGDSTEDVSMSDIISTFYMRKNGSKDIVGTISYRVAKDEYNLQKELYKRGLKVSSKELCPSAMYIYSSSIKNLPPSLSDDLQFSLQKSFATEIEMVHNPFRVSLFVMELYDDAFTLHDIVYGRWNEQIVTAMTASTDICIKAGYSGDKDAIVHEALTLGVKERYASTCIQLLLSRLRRHIIAVYEHGIIHGDPSLSNCLINTKGKITFIDYGMGHVADMTRFNTLDDVQKIHAIVNSCEFPNYPNYKWLFKLSYDEQHGNKNKTKIDISEINAVLVAPERTIVQFYGDIEGFAEGVITL